jgi:hypothetical protein|tara:strand:- start:880 stop:1083 length:204 start_codon:yes stop_codon:yes gene_type:complete
MTTDWLAKYDTGDKELNSDSDFPYGVSKWMKCWLVEQAKKDSLCIGRLEKKTKETVEKKLKNKERLR